MTTLNITRMPGVTRYLAERGVTFDADPSVAQADRVSAGLRDHAGHRDHRRCREARALLESLILQAQVTERGHRVYGLINGEWGARRLNGRITGKRWRWLHRVRGDHLESYVVDDDGVPYGPCNTIEKAREIAGRHGGGWMELDGPEHVALVPDLGGPDQMPLFKALNGCGGRKDFHGWRFLEDHPLA